MSIKRRGLGRGLDALLGDSARNTTPSDEAYRELPVHQIERGKYQPRREIRQDALEELAASIRAQGLMQPVVVRVVGQDRYELIAGERRWRAAQLAGMTAIPAMVRDVPDESALALALIENVQRENLNPVEEAFALKRLQDEFGLTQQEAADAVGKSRVTVTNLLRLLNLEPEVRELLERGALEMGHARAAGRHFPRAGGSRAAGGGSQPVGARDGGPGAASHPRTHAETRGRATEGPRYAPARRRSLGKARCPRQHRPRREGRGAGGDPLLEPR